MALKRRALIFPLLIVAVVAVLLASQLRDKPHPLPDDDRHRPFAVQLRQGEARTGVEQGCVSCHNPQQRPLPSEHPPKEQCLICHPANV